MAGQIAVGRKALAPRKALKHAWKMKRDLSYRRLAIVNVTFVGSREEGWVLVDAGLPGTSSAIKRAAKELFGDQKPHAIILTHGHFDHVGALRSLSAEWDVPVYAHEQEHPYLNGSRSYPPADPAADSGLMALISPLYPRSPTDIGEHLMALPPDGSVPHLVGWRWVHTPGHSPGHVSLWRESDRVLLAGDAVVTTRQEAVYAVIEQEPELHGPPRYFTPDWTAAAASVRTLAALEPELLLSGHGRPLAGPGMWSGLSALAENFERVARPKTGRYSRRPALA
jgi:glyoxylase-like metal-dependent hydrolase (beta-lactamase superfamily II)